MKRIDKQRLYQMHSWKAAGAHVDRVQCTGQIPLFEDADKTALNKAEGGVNTDR